MKYKILKGNTSHQCAWIVASAKRIRDWNVIAEFWDKKDAQIFIKAKQHLTKE